MNVEDIFWIVLIFLLIVIPTISAILKAIKNKLKQPIDSKSYYLHNSLNVDKNENIHNEKENYRTIIYNLNIALEREQTEKENYIKRNDDLLKLIDEKKQNQPWLSTIFADYTELISNQHAKMLETKERPALKAALEVRAISKQKKELEFLYRTIKYQLNFYENLFPWLEDFKEIDIADAMSYVNIDSISDQSEYQLIRKWLSPKEYSNLITSEKYQLALDRYRNSSDKTNWQIGIEYERYIGYRYELKGYKVEYSGALKGLDDLGRDLVIKKRDTIKIIQCKYWNSSKTIHEKHVFQLFGSMFAYKIENNYPDVKGVFITSASLSRRAKLYAKELGIIVLENIPISKDYPCIKCNINKTTKEKIYHLPFDQQYDKIDIDFNAGEFYANTTAEAEEKGFRRASRWIPE